MPRFEVSYWVRHATSVIVEAESSTAAAEALAARVRAGEREVLAAAAVAADAQPDVDVYCVGTAPEDRSGMMLKEIRAAQRSPLSPAAADANNWAFADPPPGADAAEMARWCERWTAYYRAAIARGLYAGHDALGLDPRVVGP
jgi:hypothetical protein